MLTTISPDQFNTIPWKNGRGITTELAISTGGSVNDFDWRLSIASVVENGTFSDFSGYDRQLILLKGNGIKLTHDEQKVDKLMTPLSVAVFNGGSRTVGELIQGPINDFNVMTKQGHFKAETKTYTKPQTITSSTSLLNFIYAVSQPIQVQVNQEQIELPQDHLLQISNEVNQEFQVTGKDFIVISLMVVT